MKKVKIMITSIAVLAVVGGALAFKARSLNTFFSYDPVNQTCNVATTILSTETNGDGVFFPYTDVESPAHNGPLPCGQIKLTETD